MKFLKLLILCLLLVQCCFAQNPSVFWLFNKKIHTYVDSRDGAEFTVSFYGDSLKNYETPPLFIIDSSVYQIVSFDIAPEKINWKYDERGEKYLLDSIDRSEQKYNEEEVLQTSLNVKSEFFKNKRGKQFLLSYYELPFLMQGQTRNGVESDSVKFVEKAIKYQLSMMFIANSKVVLVGAGVFDTDNLQQKIKELKEISNSVRIYAGKIDMDILYYQISSNEKNTKYIINLESEGLKLEMPYWLNFHTGKYIVNGGFPDINNVTNALILANISKEKSGANSLDEFYKNLLENKKYNYKEKKKSNGITQFKVLYTTEAGNIFYCQFAFFETKNKYNWVNFTATKETYGQNLGKFEEFINGIYLNAAEEKK